MSGVKNLHQQADEHACELCGLVAKRTTSNDPVRWYDDNYGAEYRCSAQMKCRKRMKELINGLNKKGHKNE